LSSVALRLDFDGETVRAARLVLGGVAPIPWRVQPAEAALAGQKIDDALIEKVANLALAGAEPLSQNAFKIPLTKALVSEALRSLAKG
jgi:xanthine dehydrogenase YagS FAD-binding subunit